MGRGIKDEERRFVCAVTNEEGGDRKEGVKKMQHGVLSLMADGQSINKGWVTTTTKKVT